MGVNAYWQSHPYTVPGTIDEASFFNEKGLLAPTCARGSSQTHEASEYKIARYQTKAWYLRAMMKEERFALELLLSPVFFSKGYWFYCPSSGFLFLNGNRFLLDALCSIGLANYRYL